jgi:hypothetical protein
MSQVRDASPRAVEHEPIAWGLVATATLIAGATIALIWLAAVPWGPVVCPAIYPMPTNCVPEYRAGTAVVMSLVVSAVYISTILAAVVGRRSRALVVAGVALLSLLMIASYLLIAWAPGFPIGALSGPLA